MVDEARRPGAELAVDFVGGAGEARVHRGGRGELVEREEVDVFALGEGGLLAAPVGFGRGDDFAEVFVDELALLYVDFGSDACVRY